MTERMEITSETDGPIDPTVFAGLESLELAGAQRLVRKLLLTYLSEAAVLVERIALGSASDNPEELRRPAHSLKSSSGNVGALALAELCHVAGSAARLRFDCPRPPRVSAPRGGASSAFRLSKIRRLGDAPAGARASSATRSEGCCT